MTAPVRISELIERLAEFQARYGDAPVFIEDADSGWMTEVEDVDFAAGVGCVALAVQTPWDEDEGEWIN